MDRALLGVHQDDFDERGAGVDCDRLEAADLAQTSEVLRHDDVSTSAKVGAGHAEGDRAGDFAGFRETVLPAANHSAELVDVEIEHARVIVDVQLRES